MPPARPDTPPAPAIAWHAVPPAAALAHFGVDPSRGLAADAVARQQADHGPNALPEPPPRPLWRLVGRQFRSPLIYLLFVAALLAVALGHLGDAGVILGVVLVNALVGAFQEGRAERSMAALRRLSTVQVRVLRGGAEQVLPAAALVPGDLVLLAAGDAVAADARLIEATRLQVAEAALTGESVPVAKATPALPEATGLADRHGMVYAGTFVTAGRALALVVATGRHTEVGRIAGLTERAEEPPTPLAQRLAQFGRALVVAALALFVVVVLLGLWRALPLPELLMVAVSQVVSLVPEGLPVAMTIALAVGMRRMAERGAIIRRLAAVETLGATTVICSDKTGTLTRNEMTVVQLWLPGTAGGAGRGIAVGGIGLAPSGTLVALPAGSPDALDTLTDAQGARGPGAAQPVTASSDPALAALLQAAVLCNDAELLPPEDGRGGWSVLGDPTEGALLVVAAKAGLDVAALRRAAPRVAELPFDADSKLMATGHRPAAAAPGDHAVFVKGAPEALLRLAAGSAAEHDAARRAAEAMAGQALRVLAIGSVAAGPGGAAAGDPAGGRLDAGAGFDALHGRVRLLGLAGQIDPPREEAKAAVAACRRAGIRPMMLTGDHKLTGLAIARALHIAGDGDLAVDGPELERMGEAELRALLPRIAVFARVQPAQKLRIVQALQAGGEVVAMTGDGVNDAPALARADVGVAMGITGTEVAKSAAKVVVTDDDFATIVAAVEQGRVVHANVRKVILYLFATSVDEVLVLALALLAGHPLPLAAVQILWINIVTEGTLTVNLVMDPADGGEMQRPPVPRDEPLLTRGLLGRMALMAGVAAAAAYGWFSLRLAQGAALDLVRTEVFTLVAMSQWFNVLNCQSATASAFGPRLLRNRWLAGGLALSIVLQALVLYAPPMNALFHTVPLPLATLLPLVVLASAVLWVEELRKLVARARGRRRATAA